MRCDKSCPDIKKQPCFEQFKNYSFFDREKQPSQEIDNYRNFYVKNDNIAIRPKKVLPHKPPKFLVDKQIIGPHHESYEYSSWVPKQSLTTNNRSSVNYNILADYESKDDFWSKKIDNLKNQSFNKRQKGITEYSDLTAECSLRHNDVFMENYNKNPHIFKNYRGVFSNMYEMAKKNGNLSVPFRKSSDFLIGQDHTQLKPKFFKYESRRKKKEN